MRNDICANCRRDLMEVRCTGESGIFQRGGKSEPIDLCEPCWLAEEDMIENGSSGNDYPDVLRQYWLNLGSDPQKYARAIPGTEKWIV